MRKNFTLRINLDLQRKNYLKAFKSYEKKDHDCRNGTSQCKTKEGLYYHSKIELINEFIGGAIWK